MIRQPDNVSVIPCTSLEALSFTPLAVQHFKAQMMTEADRIIKEWEPYFSKFGVLSDMFDSEVLCHHQFEHAQNKHELIATILPWMKHIDDFIKSATGINSPGLSEMC